MKAHFLHWVFAAVTNAWPAQPAKTSDMNEHDKCVKSHARPNQKDRPRHDPNQKDGESRTATPNQSRRSTDSPRQSSEGFPSTSQVAPRGSTTVKHKTAPERTPLTPPS